MNLVQIERTSTIEQLLENVLEKTENKNSNIYKQIDNILQSKSTKYIPATILL
ncbi:unnamed protein product, partial [Rotaria magnacalcarata]